MKASFIGMLFVAILLGACAPLVESVRLTEGTYPPTDPSQIRIYNQSLPDQPFIEIGIVKIIGKKRHTMTQMINLMRQQAAAQGADAILLRDPKEVHAGYVASGGILIVIQNKVLQGTTIRFKNRP